MALSKEKKNEVVAEISSLLSSSKLTVIAKYDGTSVSSMQALRRQARDGGTQIKVVKNRLFKLALAAEPKFKGVTTADLTGQLLYAFNSEDEVAPAQSLAAFAKTEPQLQFVGGLSEDGSFIDAIDIATLANLPSKDNLRASLAGTIAAPLSGFVNVMAGNVRGVLNVLNARSEQIS